MVSKKSAKKKIIVPIGSWKLAHRAWRGLIVNGGDKLEVAKELLDEGFTSEDVARAIVSASRSACVHKQ
jgi:hypothetical protein